MSDLILCTVCARGGSKGVPGKNTRDMLGKPLIAHTLEHARSSGLFHKIAVSSEDAQILEVAIAYGADLVVERPAHLASDTAGKLDAIRHAALDVEARTGETYSHFFDLDATSPLRTVDDIIACYGLLVQRDCDTVITGCPARRSPYFNLVEEKRDGGVGVVCATEDAVLRRQDAPACFDMNASIYGWTRPAFMAGPSIFGRGTRLHVMPEERSIDIDNALDWEIVEFVMKRNEGVANAPA